MAATRGDEAAVPASSKAPRVAGKARRRGAVIVASPFPPVRAENRFDSIDLLRDLLADLFTDHLSDRPTGQPDCFFRGVCFAPSSRAAPRKSSPVNSGVLAAAGVASGVNTGGRLRSLAITFSTLI